jgi:hypothetical protein
LSGCREGSASQVEISAQIRLANLHSKKRCIPISGTLRQSIQVELCVQPLACSLSAVQILSWTASQLKEFAFWRCPSRPDNFVEVCADCL